MARVGSGGNGAIVVLAVAFTLLVPASASADDRCPPDAEVRTQFIQRELQRDAANARMWSVGWGITSVAVAGGSFTLAALDSDKNARTGGYVWAGASLIPGALLLFFPLHVMHDARALDADVAGEPDRCLVLARAEAFLERDASQEAAGTAWYTHAVAIGFNLTLGAVLAYTLDDLRNNAISAGIGIVLSELQILTQPVGAVRTLRQYRAGALGMSF